MRQKKRPHQGDTERIEVQTPDDEIVQNRDPASRGLWVRWDGHVPEFYPLQSTMAADSCGKRIKTARTTAILHFHFGENGDPGIWFPLDQLRTWLELQGDEMGHRFRKIDVARAWAAASANMKKEIQIEYGQLLNDCDNGNLARPQHHPCFPIEMASRRKSRC